MINNIFAIIDFDIQVESKYGNITNRRVKLGLPSPSKKKRIHQGVILRTKQKGYIHNRLVPRQSSISR